MTDTEEAQATASTSTTTTTPTEKDAAKICVLLNATGNVPIIKKRTWTVDPNKTVSWIQKFIHKFLKLDANEQIFLYVNQTFAPAPDQIIKNLYECHGTNGKLVLYYCKNQAWG
ncbi:autophagy protein 12-like [Drosophila grimshawi]|uniref:Ubiquitin-like protein ATG12 n=1 Tax=Drosophila grimshawi TaxID=7222 RepID=B4IWM8_DROGR|nr:autophagy protein 12-like [Drosophila grimshawi]EDV96254.1 GH16151 [Drosophila grimshawi]